MASRSTVALTACAVLALGPAGPAAGQGASTYQLADIMRGYETVGREPTGVQWTPDSRWIYFSWLPAGRPWNAPMESYRVKRDSDARPERVSQAHLDSMAPVLAGGMTTRDGRRRAVAVRGDLWLVDLPSGVTRRLTRTTQAEQLIGWSADESRLFYRTADNAFALRILDGYVEQLTDLRSGVAPDSARKSVQRTALERDQLALLQVIRDRAAADSVVAAERTARDSQALRPSYLGRDTRQRGMWVAPAGKYLVLQAANDAQTRATQVPAYVTASGYTEDIPSRTKVGDAQGRLRLALVDLQTGVLTWLPLPLADSTGTGIGASVIGWNDAGDAAMLNVGSSDNTTRVLARLDIASGTVTPLLQSVDSAWVGGPCGGCAGWLPGGRGIWAVSEADGHAHLYVMDRDGGNLRQLTRGAFEVRGARLSASRDRFELQTSETSPHDNQFWVMSLDGGSRKLVTPQPGLHQVSVSPDGEWLADVHSRGNQPPELYVRRTRAGTTARRITTTPSAEWSAQRWLDPEIVEILASDGVKVPARIYRPEDLGVAPNGAAVLFVHGAGYLQNVHHGWSTYFREYQFHHLLASKGYVVLDVDYRASAGYGRDWRTAVYRHMGGRDLEDFVDASKWLTASRGISPDRIGIYGGSYGGFITLMALFTRPAYFGAGAALRSVTDWAHYNHGYTSNILNEPQSDTLAYRRSSPIFFAEGLEDPLLIAHGMIDTNVHFQDVVRLSQRLIELGKTRWELAVYPVEDHGFVRPDSWTDEYRRILELFDRWLPAGAEGTPSRE
ncbi:MAG: prolyl oligopeptidase family serine peptidase [Gemmatimonadales bacterium]|nr:prolyl oligopeptidase family serine peptidase [Gemmatimonadales bacterium]